MRVRLLIQVVRKKKLHMPIYKILRNVSLAFILATGVQTQTYAFDANELIKEDTGSVQIFEFFFSFRKDGKKDEALKLLQYAAEKGNSAAQWKLARIYQTGDGVKKDPLAAFRIFEQIAKQYPFARPNTPSWQFSADALVALGNYYRNGINGTVIKPSPSQATVMYTTAAMVFRHPDAQFELGRMQLNNEKGFGQARSGIRNLGLAYEKGHVGAEALLGYSIFEGENIRHDPVKGLMMLHRAKNRAVAEDLEWILPLHDEAFAIASPQDRASAINEITSKAQ